jgi:hypothetical protein
MVRGMQNEPLSDISLSQFNKREIKILPGFTHWATKFNFPNKDCNSFFEAIILCIQHSTSKRISVSLFSSIAIVDLAGCEEEHYCNFAFDFLGKLLQDCGIEESVDKACPPSTRMIFIGILLSPW